MIRAAIIGGSGYAGGELLRLLLWHPQVQLTAVTSNSHTGKPVSAVHPNLTKLTSLHFVEEDLDAVAVNADVIFFALPHGEALTRIPAVVGRARVLDLGGDFRLKDAAVYTQTYKLPHTTPELLEAAVYGLTEWNREAIATAQLVACPGCFPTGALLALLPLARAGWLGGPVVIDSKTGSSGSGNKPVEGTHHPERAHDFRAYGLFNHRHAPEISQELERAAGDSLDMTFTPHSAPMVRGIFTTAYAFLREPTTPAQLTALYEAAYGAEPFIRLVEQARCAVVAHSNFCDISLACSGRKVIITSALDNLVKGAAGQAVQNMNVMFGLPETTGLLFPGTHP